jgi:DNA mismatch endonuclease (patch repair protein)
VTNPANERWVSTEAGRHLSGRRSHDTKPELRLRSELHRRGFRFRLHRSLAPGCNPDLVMPRYRLAVWVDGCFWHGHGHEHAPPPTTGPNAALWATKIENNRARDRRATETATQLGWGVVRAWECQVKQDVIKVGEAVATAAASSVARMSK